MASFEEHMEEMSTLSPEEIGELMGEVKAACICGDCPSYADTGETGGAFCANGKSEYITENKGCNCGDCPVTGKMGLRWGGYCMQGSARGLWDAESKGSSEEETPAEEEPAEENVDE
ncbi:MAG TPA: DUF2769 domain-containing protein [Candidatus Lokiarchaeia archaeon]|nr:DUF2769 domain-containing protein [Candidatus Lokiarchaeia archaeon]